MDGTNPDEEALKAALVSGRKPPPVLCGYAVCEKLGHGIDSIVYRGQRGGDGGGGLDDDNTNTAEQVAIKRFFNPKKEQYDAIYDEARRLRELKHPNVIYLVKIEENQSNQNNSNTNNVDNDLVFNCNPTVDPASYIFLEYVGGGTLRSFLKKGKTNSDGAIKIGANIACGLHYLHTKARLLHRDIKPLNILLVEKRGENNDKEHNYECKIADFGSAIPVNDNDAIDSDLNATTTGTPHYMPPETILQKTITTKLDIWSWAATLVECLTSLPPFGQLEPMAAMHAIVQEQVKIPKDNASEPLQELLQLCFSKKSVDRPSAADILNHACMRSYARSLPGYPATEKTGSTESACNCCTLL